MKTKSKYIIFIGIILFVILVLFYKNNSEKDKVFYVENGVEIKDEGKLAASVASSKITEKSELNVLFVGDIMTDRYIRKRINKYENIKDFVEKYLNNLKEVNRKYDYVVANLEGPVTNNKSKTLNDDGSYGKDLIFTFPISTIEILKELNIKVVNLANNHTDNFYYKGFLETISFLKDNNIEHFGNPYNSESDKLSQKVCEKNICVAYIGYNKFTKNNSSEIIIKEIERIKSNKDENNLIDFVVVMPHWGDEYDKISNESEISLAHAWIDAGADLVVGTHPHVIQNSEIYKGKYIYYSLGNYIFDQWFTEDVKNGLGLGMTFKKECKENNLENICKREIILNKELKVFIDKNGVKYNL